MPAGGLNAPQQQQPGAGALQPNAANVPPQQQHQRDRSPFVRGPVQLTNQNVHMNNMGEDRINSHDQLQQQIESTTRQIQELSRVEEQQVFEDARSENTVVVNQQEATIPYVPEMQAIGNQLEMQSMMSDHASVMGQSPAKPSRVASRRGTKAKKVDH